MTLSAASPTVAVIQARMGSTRLPGKVLKDLGGKPVLAWLVDAARAIPGVDQVVVATSAGAGDDAVAQWGATAGVTVHRGSESDVLGRVHDAAAAVGAGTVLRLTADCPFLDPVLCGEVLLLHRLTGADYSSNTDPRSYPDGLDCEVISMATLAAAHAGAVHRFDREHVTPYIRARDGIFKIERLICPIPGLADVRLTLDQPEDFDLMTTLLTRLGPAVSRWPALVDALRADPSLRQVNQAHALPMAGGAVWRPATPGEAGRFVRSKAMLARAKAVIPTGTQTFSKSYLQYPADAPFFLTYGDGAHVWDVDGDGYVDLINGLLPVVLGYRDPDVDAAARRQLARGVSFSLATELEVKLAEKLREIIPCAEMVRFGKNGTDATSGAIRVARAVTGRDRIAVGGYHGWQDWYIGWTTRNKGVPPVTRALTSGFTFNDLDSLRQTLEQHPGEFAAVILEPCGFAEPAPGYLAAVKQLVHDHGALLVFDEIVTGFRVALGGAQAYYGVSPDLACFGKAMANGYPLSAVVGAGRYMREFEEVFLSGTFGGEALSLAASLATIDKLAAGGMERLWDRGRRLTERVEAVIAEKGCQEMVTLNGVAPWKVFAWKDQPNGSGFAVKTLFLREMLQRGVLVNASHNVNCALTDADIDHVVASWGLALDKINYTLGESNLDELLGSDVIRPIFQVRKTA